MTTRKLTPAALEIARRPAYPVPPDSYTEHDPAGCAYLLGPTIHQAMVMGFMDAGGYDTLSGFGAAAVAVANAKCEALAEWERENA